MISVVITCYNHARFLAEAIQSTLAQTRQASEVIVVDDGSRDDSPSVAARYQSIRYIRQTNAGVCAARNVGWRACTGEYVVFLDGDDRLLPNALAVGADSLDSHEQCAFVFGRCRLFADDGHVVGADTWSRVDQNHYRELLLQNYIWMPATVMHRRVALEAAGGFDPATDHASDYDLYLRLSRVRSIFCHGEFVAEWRIHDSNLSRDVPRMLRSTLTAYRRQKAHAASDDALRDAYERGKRFWETRYGDAAVDVLRGHLDRGESRQAAVVMLALLRHSPGVLLARVRRRLARVLRGG